MNTASYMGAILPIMLVQFAMQVAAILVALFIWDRFRRRTGKEDAARCFP
jgi:hypothetical protein